MPNESGLGVAELAWRKCLNTTWMLQGCAYRCKRACNLRILRFSSGKFRVSWSGAVGTLWKSTLWSPRTISCSVFSAFRMGEHREPKQALNKWCSYCMGFWEMPQIGSRIIRTTVWDTYWQTMVLMFGLVTSGVTDTPDVTSTWIPASVNSGIGGEFAWGSNWFFWTCFWFCFKPDSFASGPW